MGWFDLTPEEITEGPIPRALIVLTAPMLVQNMVHVAQQVIDLYWVGRYSSQAVAAIGLASPVVWFLLSSTITGAFVGTQVLVSQRVGADDTRAARSAAFTGLLLTSTLGIGIGLVLYFNIGWLLSLVTSLRPETVDSGVPRLATEYIEVIALGIVFAGLSDVIEAAFLGWGDSRAALYMNVTGVLVNIGLDPILIFGAGPIPGFGIQGAALATVVGYAAGFLVGAVLVARGRAGGIYSWATARINPGDVREFIDIGLPKAVQGGAATSGKLVMVTVVFAAAGAPGLAAYTVGSRVGSIALRVAMSLNHAAQSIVGQNLGAGYPQRAADTTWIGAGAAAGTLGVIGIGQWVAPASITLFIAPELDGRSFVLAIACLRIFAIGYPVNGALSLIKAGLDGARRTKTTMVASLAKTWFLQIPMAIFGGVVLGFGAFGVFWARTISIFVVAISLGGYYLYMINDGLYERAAQTTDTPSSD